LPNNETTKKDVLNTVFQIWQRKDTKRTKIVVPDNGLIKKLKPVTKTQETHRKIKDTLYRKVSGKFEAIQVDTYEKVKVRRPDYITGANFQIVQFGHSCGACKDITEHRVQAKTTTMYLYIDRDDVKAALRAIDFSKYYKNVSYVSALSIQEINYELNEWFGLPNFKFN
jgi:DNA-dependent RNA polymerase auxiliary subunit epsilon